VARLAVPVARRLLHGPRVYGAACAYSSVSLDAGGSRKWYHRPPSGGFSPYPVPVRKDRRRAPMHRDAISPPAIFVALPPDSRVTAQDVPYLFPDTRRSESMSGPPGVNGHRNTGRRISPYFTSRLHFQRLAIAVHREAARAAAHRSGRGPWCANGRKNGATAMVASACASTALWQFRHGGRIQDHALAYRGAVQISLTKTMGGTGNPRLGFGRRSGK